MLISATATRMKGRFTDIIPVRPGSFTLNRAARQATSRKEMKRARLSEVACIRALPSTANPAITTRAIKRRADLEDGILVFSVLRAAQRSHSINTPDDGIAPDDAEPCIQLVAPGDAVTPDNGVGEHCVTAPHQ